LVDRHLARLAEDGRSAATMDTYKIAARNLAELLGGVRVGEATPARLDALRSMRDTRGATSARQAKTSWARIRCAMFSRLNPRQRRRALPYLGEQHLIFPSTAGTLRDPNNFGRLWRTLRDELGVPEVTMHSLRKTGCHPDRRSGLVGPDRGRSPWARQGVDDPGPLHVPRADAPRHCPATGPHHKR
jgi:integrase